MTIYINLLIQLPHFDISSAIVLKELMTIMVKRT